MTCQQPEEKRVSAERGNTLFVALQQMLYEVDTVESIQAWDIDLRAVSTQAFLRVMNATAPQLVITSPPLTGGVSSRTTFKTLSAESDDEEMPGLLDESVSESDED